MCVLVLDLCNTRDVDNLHIESIHEKKIEKSLALATKRIARRHVKLEQRRKKMKKKTQQGRCFSADGVVWLFLFSVFRNSPRCAAAYNRQGGGMPFRTNNSQLDRATPALRCCKSGPLANYLSA